MTADQIRAALDPTREVETFAATNGVQWFTDTYVAIGCDHVTNDFKPSMRLPRLVEKIADPSAEINWIEFRLKIGDYVPPVDVKCDDCDGAGEADHCCGCDLCQEETEECQTCEGTGKYFEYPAARYIRIGDMHLESNRFARVMASLEVPVFARAFAEIAHLNSSHMLTVWIPELPLRIAQVVQPFSYKIGGCEVVEFKLTGA